MRDRDRDVTVELRKNKRDDTLTKKRQIEGLTIDSTDDEDLRENLSTASMYFFECCAELPTPKFLTVLLIDISKLPHSIVIYLKKN